GAGRAGENVITAGSHSLVNGNTVINSVGNSGIDAGDHSTISDNVVNITSVTVAGISVGAHSEVLRNTVLGYNADGIDVTCPSAVKFNTVAFGGTQGLVETGAGCVNVGNNAP